jgi:hypothetical protein
MSYISLALTEYDSAMTRLLREIQRGFEKADPILSEVQRLPVSHDGRTRQVSTPNIVDTNMQDFSADVTIHADAFRRTDVEKFVEFIWGLCEALMSQTTKYLFETVSRTSEAVGNVVDFGGKNFWDAQIEMLEKTEMHFDANGDHNYKFYMHPDTFKKLSAVPPTPHQQQRWNDVMKTKKEEFYAKKRTRRLS